jgi:hypothetical protein
MRQRIKRFGLVLTPRHRLFPIPYHHLTRAGRSTVLRASATTWPHNIGKDFPEAFNFPVAICKLGFYFG